MIRVREIDGHIVVDNDPEIEAEFRKSQAEADATYKHFEDQTKKRWEEHCVITERKWQDALSPPPPPRCEPAPLDHHAAPVVSAQATERVALADPERRLITLRELGGTAKWKRGRGGIQAWQFTGIAKLAQQEKAQGRKRHDEKTIREDLREAAQAESMAKRSA